MEQRGRRGIYGWSEGEENMMEGGGIESGSEKRREAKLETKEKGREEGEEHLTKC